MKHDLKNALPGWNVLLLVSVIFAAFVLPNLPFDLHRGIFRLVYSIIYLSAFFFLKKRSKYILTLFLTTLLLEWVSALFNMPGLNLVSKGINIIFFLVVVFSLIWQIAAEKNVNAEMIIGSIAGYLLLGLVYSIFVAIIMQHDPESFTRQAPATITMDQDLNTSDAIYFSYVTLATLGYGDMVPLKPYTRSISTWIAISGQFYIAVIVALLVGKFSTRIRNPEEKQ